MGENKFSIFPTRKKEISWATAHVGVQDVLILTAALKKLNTFNPHVLSMDNVEFQMEHVKLHENFKPSKYKYCLGTIAQNSKLKLIFSSKRYVKRVV